MQTNYRKPNMPTTKKTISNSKKADYIYSVGRRKQAIARIRLYPKKDTKNKNIDIMVNDKPIGQYFPNPVTHLHYAQPLELTKTTNKYSVTVKVIGSGPSSQLDAIKHGIARALVKADEDHRPVLRKNGLLTRDPRKRERRKVGLGGSARAKKQSPKR